MQINREDYIEHFAALSDEALLQTPRGDLVETAQACLDEEIARRGISAAPAAGATETNADPREPEEAVPEMVVAGEYQDAGEADLASALLRSSGIEAILLNERLANILKIPLSPGTYHLLVPAESEEEALQILTSEISEEELTAQAEAAGEEE